MSAHSLPDTCFGLRRQHRVDGVGRLNLISTCVGGRCGGERDRVILDRRLVDRAPLRRRHGTAPRFLLSSARCSQVKHPLRRGPDHERDYEHYEDDTVDVHPRGKNAG